MEPSALFDRLFAVPPDTRELPTARRLLDAVLEDAQGLRAQPRRRRIAAASTRTSITCAPRSAASRSRLAPHCEVPGRPGDDGDLMQKTRTMGDLLALAARAG
jgi:hypothetical protein